MDSLSSFFTSMIINEISDKYKIHSLTSMYILSTLSEKHEHVKPKSTLGNRWHRCHDLSSMTSAMIMVTKFGELGGKRDADVAYFGRILALLSFDVPENMF